MPSQQVMDPHLPLMTRGNGPEAFLQSLQFFLCIGAVESVQFDQIQFIGFIVLTATAKFFILSIFFTPGLSSIPLETSTA